jgi:hypothetical protein
VELSLFGSFRSFIYLFVAPEVFVIIATHECDAQANGACLPMSRDCRLAALEDFRMHGEVRHDSRALVTAMTGIAGD